MNKKRKTALYFSGGAIVLVLAISALKFLSNGEYRSSIPELANTSNVSQPVKEQIQEAYSKARRNPTAGNIGKLGMVYHSCANYDQAAQCYELATRKDKSEWIWNYYLGFLDTEIGNSNAAIENFKKVVGKNPGAYHAWYYIGQEYKNLRKNDLAEEILSKISGPKNIATAKYSTTREDHFPINVYANFLLARIYFDTGKTGQAEKKLDEIIQGSSNQFGPAYRLLSNIYAAKGDSSLSRQYNDKANDLLVFSPPVDSLVDKLVLISRSELYLLKKIDEAEKSIYPEWCVRLVNNALEYIPDNKYTYSKAIKIFLWNNLDKQAASLADKHIGDFQDNYAEMKNTGLLFYQRGLFQIALKYWEKTLALKPGDAETAKNQALCFYYMGDKQKSNTILTGLIEKNQGKPDVMADATYALFHLGGREQATVYLNKLKQIAPSNAIVLKLSGEIADGNGETQKAISLYEASFKADPEDLQTIRYFGNLLVKQKSWDKYIKLYREALGYHPNDPELLERLGTCLVICPDPKLRNIDEGVVYSERAFTHVKSAVSTMVTAGKNLALAYAFQGNKQKAITTISKTINLGRQENIPASYQAELETLYKTIKNMK
jgi:tetratricopeptide (TPR) repeat protein